MNVFDFRVRKPKRALLPGDVQFGGFWVIAVAAALSFYWALQRWHRELKWNPASR